MKMSQENKIVPLVVSAAGLDPSAGAGVYADVKTCAAFNVYCMAIPTTLTLQNAERFYGLEPVDQDYFRKTLFDVFSNNKARALKIGLITEKFHVDVLAECIQKFKPASTILDPVMRSSNGFIFWGPELIEYAKEKLLGIVDVITPNVYEAEQLTGESLCPRELAVKLNKVYRCKVALTGGDVRTGTGDTVRDIFYDGYEIRERNAKFIDAPKHIKHGTGCRFSSALAANLALGHDFMDACFKSALYVEETIRGDK
ncbi:MAG: hydroxymethylpyrimidine/phosphomethylpyrimidine kinase [Pseudomonadota bacterium]